MDIYEQINQNIREAMGVAEPAPGETVMVDEDGRKKVNREIAQPDDVANNLLHAFITEMERNGLVVTTGHVDPSNSSERFEGGMIISLAKGGEATCPIAATVVRAKDMDYEEGTYNVETETSTRSQGDSFDRIMDRIKEEYEQTDNPFQPFLDMGNWVNRHMLLDLGLSAEMTETVIEEQRKGADADEERIAHIIQGALLRNEYHFDGDGDDD